MCITISVSERGRRWFGLTCTLLHFVLFVMAVILFICALAIRIKLDERLELLDGYDAGALPYYLMVSAGILFFVHLLGMKICFDASYPSTRSEKNYLFVAFVVLVFVMSIYVFICMIVTWVHMSKIRTALREGLTSSIKGYSGDLAAKQRIDRLQLEFQCCGVDSYLDYFKISWISTAYVNSESDEIKPFLKDGVFLHDDVPFSCCSIESKTACIHHSIKTLTKHKGFAGVTLNLQGCVDVVGEYFEDGIMIPTGVLLVVMFILEVIVALLMRMLQTSILSADEMNDPEGPGEAYCIKGVGGGSDNRKYFGRKQDEEEGDDEDGGGGSGFRSRRRAKDDDDEDDDNDDDYDEVNETTTSKKKGFFSGFGKKKDKGGKGGDDADDSDDSGGGKKEKKDKKGKKGEKEGKGKGKKKGKDKEGKDKEGKDKKGKDKKGKGKKEKEKKGKDKKGKDKKGKDKDKDGKKGKGIFGKKKGDKKAGKKADKGGKKSKKSPKKSPKKPKKSPKKPKKAPKKKKAPKTKKAKKPKVKKAKGGGKKGFKKKK